MMGIYAIVNDVTSTRYVGSSVDIDNRWRGHITDLRRNKHHCVYLQRAWDKYGQDAFSFIVLQEVTERAELLTTEQTYLDNEKNKYNINVLASCPNPWKGKTLSQDHKLKIAASHVGIKHSAESRIKIGLAGKGRVCKDESKQKLSNALTGKAKPPRTREHRENQSAARKGRPNPKASKHWEENKEDLRQGLRDAFARDSAYRINAMQEGRRRKAALTEKPVVAARSQSKIKRQPLTRRPMSHNARAALLKSNHDRKGKELSPAAKAHLEHIQALAHPPEANAKRSETMKGRSISAPLNKGRKFSTEHIQKLSESHIGIKMPQRTPEHRKNLSKANTGKTRSIESRQKQSKSRTGKRYGPRGPYKKVEAAL